MNVKELEQQVRSLPAPQLKRFSQWFDDYRQQSPSSPASVNSEDDLSAKQKEEILLRRAAYLADPSIATPWEGAPERLIKQLRARRRQKTPARGS